MLAAASYWQTIDFGFIRGDDDVILVRNPLVRQLTPRGLTDAFTKPAGDAYLPVRLILHMAEYRCWGMWPGGYHAINAALYGLCCGLLCALAMFFVPAPAAAGAALLYVWHPAHVEAVAWVSGRKEVLSSAFMFAAMLIFASGLDRSRITRRAGAAIVLLGAAGMFAKATAVVLPVLLLALMLHMTGVDRRRRGALAVIVVLFLVAAGAAFLHAHIAAAHHVIKPLYGGSRWRNALYAAKGLAGHARLCVWPVSLAYRSLPTTPDARDALIALAVLVWIAWACVRAVRRRRVSLAGFAALWFAAALAPTSTFFFPTSTVVADRYVFVASFAPCLLFAAAFRRARLRWGLAAAALAWSCLTINRCLVWRDNGRFWRQAIRDAPHIASLHESLSAFYFDHGLYRRAASQIQRIFKPLEQFPRALHNLAVAEYKLGHANKALRLYQLAITGFGPRSPESARCYNGVGLILRDRGDLPGAIQMFRIALRLRPDDRVTLSNLADAFARAGKREEAIETLRSLLDRWPDYRSAHLRLGRLLLAAGKPREALRHLRRAGSSVQSETCAGLAFLALGDMRSACACLARAMRMNPYTWRPHYLAGRIAEAKGDIALAIAGYRHALRFNPRAADAAARLKRLESRRPLPSPAPAVSPRSRP